MAGRNSVRLLARQLRSQCSHPVVKRSFSSSPATLAASNFTMPAMSPTMTEGNIASWKVKEGDEYSAGDVLLEIETDKASMDVEAQEDGILAKIFVGDGSKAVKVGTRIAVMAEAGDDIKSLEIPKDDSKPIESVKDNVKGGEDASYSTSGVEKEIKGTPQNKRPSRDKPKMSAQGAGQNPKYPLYPAVLALIHENHLSDEDILKIPATGPQNRLLKGDVLAYLGSIKEDYSAEQSKRIEKLAHMDLSNIKIAPQAPKPATLSTEAAAPQLPQETTISLPISLSEVLKVQKRIRDTLGVTMPLSTFLARAVDFANDDLPLTKGSKSSSDDLFNAVLGLNSIPKTSRGTYLPQIDAFPSSMSSSTATSKRIASKKPDIIDILSGLVSSRTSSASSGSTPSSVSAALAATAPSSITTSAGAVNLFSVTVPPTEEKRARTFLERMKTILQVEPGRLVL